MKPHFPTIAMMRLIPVLLLCIAGGVAGCHNSEADDDSLPADGPPATAVISYTVTDSYLHDPTLFTEGLVFHDHPLYESTGSPRELANTESLVGTDNLQTGKFSQKIALDKSKYFGEGIVFLHDRLYQLTYKNHLGFVYDAKTLHLLKTFPFANNEGWGLTTDGKSIIMSDGTSKLTYLDPESLKPTRVLSVTDRGVTRDSLNELEYVKGTIYANIWLNNTIVTIDTASGKVTGHLDISPLYFKMHVLSPDCDVSNGIAYDSAKDRLYVSGKLWPYIFELKLD